MAEQVQPIPPGYAAVIPYLVIDGAARALEFYKKAFGAAEIMRLPGPGDSLGHAEIEIGGSRVMISDQWPEGDCRAPGHYGGTPVMIHLYVPDVDATVKSALAAGAAIKEPVSDKFYGDRSGTLVDPFGHRWHVATHIEDLSLEEMRRRGDAYLREMAKGAKANV